MKKLLANQFKNDYEYEQAKKRIKKGAVESRNKRLQRDYDEYDSLHTKEISYEDIREL